jgi:hypothetical protein
LVRWKTSMLKPGCWVVVTICEWGFGCSWREMRLRLRWRGCTDEPRPVPCTRRGYLCVRRNGIRGQRQRSLEGRLSEHFVDYGHGLMSRLATSGKPSRPGSTRSLTEVATCVLETSARRHHMEPMTGIEPRVFSLGRVRGHDDSHCRPEAELRPDVPFTTYSSVIGSCPVVAAHQVLSMTHRDPLLPIDAARDPTGDRHYTSGEYELKPVVPATGESRQGLRRLRQWRVVGDDVPDEVLAMGGSVLRRSRSHIWLVPRGTRPI